MRCAQCQHDNPTRANFCSECGTRFAFSCTKCSAELPRLADFKQTKTLFQELA